MVHYSRKRHSVTYDRKTKKEIKKLPHLDALSNRKSDAKRENFSGKDLKFCQIMGASGTISKEDYRSLSTDFCLGTGKAWIERRIWPGFIRRLCMT